MDNWMFFDMTGLAYFFVGIAISVASALFFIIIVIEAILLWRIRWGSIKKSILASIGVNIASGFVGYILVKWIGIDQLVEILRDQFLKVMIITWIMSIYIEGGLLVLLNRANWYLSLQSAFIINTASYIWNAIVLYGILHYMNVT